VDIICSTDIDDLVADYNDLKTEAVKLPDTAPLIEINNSINKLKELKGKIKEISKEYYSFVSKADKIGDKLGVEYEDDEDEE